MRKLEMFFVILAGVAHKTFNTHPADEFKLLTPSNGHQIGALDERGTLGELELSGFTMLGADPEGGIWDFARGGQNGGTHEAV